MFKKLNGPLGIALTVAGVVLALSPEARRSVRKFLVKGTAGMMDAMEGVSVLANGMMKPTSTSSNADSNPARALPHARGEDEDVGPSVERSERRDEDS